MLEIFLGSSVFGFMVIYSILELLFGKTESKKRNWRPNKEWQEILEEFKDWFKEY